MRCSNFLMGFFNFLMLLLSIPIIWTGVWLSKQEATECERFLESPLLVIGIFLMAIALIGIIGGCCRVMWLTWVYLIVMFLLIIALVIFTVFAFIVTHKGAGETLSGRGYKEFKLGHYSSWLQKRVSDSENWSKLKSCMIDSEVCKNLINDTNTTDVKQFYSKQLSSIESGCCKPLDVCNFEYVSPAHWNPITTTVSPDCGSWSNDPKSLCYNCESCKAGFLDDVKHSWKRVAILNIILLIILIIVHSVACCAFRNNQEEKYRQYQYAHPYHGHP